MPRWYRVAAALPAVALAVRENRGGASTLLSPLTARAGFEDPSALVDGLDANRTVTVVSPNEDFICCCDPTAPEPLCRYVKKYYKGCPKASLEGRARVQLTKAKTAGLSDSCKVTGQEQFKPAERSQERRQCDVSKTLDSVAFPPEMFQDYAVRFAVPNVPAAGDMYIAIRSLEVVDGSMFIDFRRKDDRTFYFKVYGDDDGQALFLVYVRGFNLYTSNGLHKWLKAAEVTDKVITNIFTLGLINVFGNKDYGSLDNLPVKIRTTLEGEFRLNDKGQWDIVPETRRQQAEVQLLNGGGFIAIANRIIDSMGGMDQIFFDNVWPIVEKLAPPELGKGFEEVPYSSGQVSQHVKVFTKCSSGVVDGNTCPGQRLEVTIQSQTNLLANAQPILRKLYEENFFVASKSIVKNFLEAYDNGERVFEGAHVDLVAEASIKKDKAIAAQATPRLDAPMALIQSVVGRGVPLTNFLRQDGVPTVAAGSLTLDNGVTRAKDFVVKPIVLPVGKEDFMEMDFEMDLEFELDDSGGNPYLESSPVFAQDCLDECRDELANSAAESLKLLSQGEACKGQAKLEATRDRLLADKIPTPVRTLLDSVVLEAAESGDVAVCTDNVRGLQKHFAEALALNWIGEDSALTVNLPQLHTTLSKGSGFTFNPARTDYDLSAKVDAFSTADGKWYKATVVGKREDGSFDIAWDSGSTKDVVKPPGHLRPQAFKYVGAILWAESSYEDDLVFENGQLTIAGETKPCTFASTDAGATLSGHGMTFAGVADHRRNIKGQVKNASGKVVGAFRLAEEATLTARLKPKFLTDLLTVSGLGLAGDPASVRKAPKEKADGVVPEEFVMPFATPILGIDLNKLIRTADVELDVRVEPVTDGADGHEAVKFSMGIDSKLDFNVGAYLYSSILNNNKPDYGYLHYSAPGVIQFDDEAHPGLAYLACGTLEIMAMPDSESKAVKVPPFSNDESRMGRVYDLKLERWEDSDYDLRAPVPYSKTGLRSNELKMAGDDWYCMPVGKYNPPVWSRKDMFFCGERGTIESLYQAVTLQQTRLQDAGERWSRSCYPGPNGDYPVCMGSPDGSWFAEWKPLEMSSWFPARGRKMNTPVVTPDEEWSEARRKVFTSYFKR